MEVVLARMRAASAIKAHHHQGAHTWSLIAFLKGNILKTDSKVDQYRTTEHWKQAVASFEEQLLNGKESEAWQRGLYWLLTAAEANQKEEIFNLLENKVLSTAHQQAADHASLISKKWQHVSQLEMGKKLICQLPFLSKFLTPCWTRLARHTERRYHSFIKTALLPEVTFCLPPQCIPIKA